MLRRRVVGPRALHTSPLSLHSSGSGATVFDNSLAALTHPTRGLSGLASTTLACHYLYKPPGTGSSETSRLPWYNRATPASTSGGGGAATATNEESPAAPQQQSSSAPSPLHLQNISTILQSAAAVHNNNNTGVNTAMAPPAAAASPSSSPSFQNNPAASRSATSTAAAGVNASSAFAARTAPPSVPSPPASVSVSAATAAAAAAALRRSDVGALRLTPTRRMSAINGPTLDVRVEDIVKVEETLASELTLPKVVQLLIDPQAEGVEQITMGEFAAMLPKRQLIAVGGKKEWLQWIEQSTHYQQAARLAAESPAQDLAALQQAGIFSLQQWLEHPQLVRVSARTRSALDTAVAQSVEAYMAEVAQVVNTSNAVEDLLVHWVSDVLGRFVLESLQLPLERASQAMWTARKDWMPADVVRNGGGLGTASATRGTDVTGGGAPQSAESRVLSEMLGGAAGSAAAQQAAQQQQQQQQRPLLRAGEACTLDHYLRFVQKVVSSVRKDYVANHAAMGHGSGARGDAQAEQEIAARSNDVIAAALVQLLEQAVLHSLPNELRSLQQSGYLALDRIPGLLKRASNLLQLRAVPVRFFVFHSAVDEAARSGSNGAAARSAAASNAGAAAAAAGGLSVPAPPHYPPGTFLTGSRQLDVTLGEWTGRPDPPSSTARETGSIVDDTTEQEYLSVLHRLRRRVDTLAVTSLYEVVAQPERYGGNGFSAVEALGLQQLFGPVKLLEDRLTSALHYPVAAAEKPIHFVAAGPLSGKTALLEQLAERATRPGDKVVLVRYGGSATPYLPDIDDHPVAFAARFWFRAALASCPYLIRTEELYSRAPRSVFWWGHKKNWSWERYQSLLQSAHNAGAGHRQQQQQRGMAGGPPAQLASILVDDVDRALGPMQQKWGDAAALSAAAHASVSAFLSSSSSSSSISSGGGSVHGAVGGVMNGALTAGSLLPAAMQKAQHLDDDADDVDEEEEDGRGGEGGSSSNSAGGANGAAASRMTPAAADPSLSLEQQRQQVVALWLSTGKSVEEHLASCFTQLSAAVGQVNLVFTGTAVTPLLLAYCAAPCRRYYLPLSGGVGLQSRLRVLPLLATLHALHLTHHLDMPGLLYEVVKNCPALAGKALELFWTHRVSTMDLRTGLPRLTMGSGSAHPQLMQSYVPRELFAELPLYTSLLQNPRRSRRRLVELLQRQLSSPTGYLNTELDTTPQDVKDGLVLPHNLTSSQVHPFALFAIFSRQDAIDERVFNSEGQLLNGSEATEGGEAAEADAADDGDAARGDGDAAAAAAAAAARVRSRTGVGSNERKVVRAWAEVWAEYRGVVAGLSTSPARKRDAMRILLHGALLLRSAAVAGAQLELNLKVPSYGFPLLASETRVRSSSAAHARGDAQIRAPTPETVRRATAAYKMFFSNAAPSHFPFRPMVGLNGGCDVVFVCGSTLALYDIVTTAAQLRHVVLRFAEALLGVLHVLERQVFPVDKVRAVQFVTVVSLDEPRPGPGDAGVSGIGSSAYYGRRRGGSVGGNSGGASSAASAAGGMSVDVFAGSSAATVPYYLDYDAIFDDDVMDRLRELQQPLGITRDFRTLSELINEVERSHRVRVMQDIVSTPEEVESLFSPTLLQLVPDSTVLPAYTSAMVSAADLMMQAMKGGSASAGSGGGGSGSGGMNSSGSNTSASAALASGRDAARIDVDDDDDDDADYVNLGEDEVAPGAELDDAASDAAAGKSDLLVADLEHLHESAELLEAMMNDNLDMMSDSTARLREQREETAHDLRRDLVMEDRINYNAPAPSPQSLAPSLPQGAAAMAAAGGNTAAAAPQSRRAVPGRTAAEEAEADALAWLHDIISPESLIAGLKGTAPGAGTALANRASSASPSGVSAAAAPGQQQSPQQQQQQAQQQSAAPPGNVGVGNFSAFAATAAAAGGGVMHPWTPNVPAAAAADGTESIAAVFPRTAAKRDEAGRGDAPSVAPATEASGGDIDDDADVVEPEKTSSADDDGDADADAEEINLQKLFDAVSSNRRRSGRATSAATSSRQQRRGGATASGRRGSGTGSSSGSSSSAKAKAKGKKAAGGASSSASKSKAKASAASGGKKKASAAKKKK